MKDLRTYVKNANLYKGGVTSLAAVGTLAVLTGGSASAMSYNPGYGQNNYNNGSYGNNSYRNNYNNHRHNRHDHRRYDNDNRRRYNW